MVTKDGELVQLSRTEWLLLQHLAANAGKVVLHTELLTKVWGPEYRDDLQYLRVWVSPRAPQARREAGRAGPHQDVPGDRLSARRRAGDVRRDQRGRRGRPRRGSVAHRVAAGSGAGSRGAGARPPRMLATPRRPGRDRCLPPRVCGSFLTLGLDRQEASDRRSVHRRIERGRTEAGPPSGPRHHLVDALPQRICNEWHTGQGKGPSGPDPASRHRPAPPLRYPRGMQRYHPGTALVVVDLQNDFADPAGGLSVAGGDAIVPTVNREIEMARNNGAHRRRHAGLAPGVDAPLRQGRRHLAGPLRRRHVGRGAAPGPGPPRRRAASPQGRQRRGRLLRLHDARPGQRRDDPDRARGAPPRGRYRSASSSSGSRPTTASRRRRSTPCGSASRPRC